MDAEISTGEIMTRVICYLKHRYLGYDRAEYYDPKTLITYEQISIDGIGGGVTQKGKMLDRPYIPPGQRDTSTTLEKLRGTSQRESCAECENVSADPGPRHDDDCVNWIPF